MRFVGNYALCGLSPQTDGMPVIPKKGLLHSQCNSPLIFPMFFVQLMLLQQELLPQLQEPLLQELPLQVLPLLRQLQELPLSL